jgi:hypothetical protein
MKKLLLFCHFLLIPWFLVAQNIGIGITNPNAKLHVGPGMVRMEGAVASGGVALSLGGYGDIEIDAFGETAGRFLIKESGRVGIGVPFPSASLDVRRFPGSLATAQFRGAQHMTRINYDDNQNTYIRAGKDSSLVILNDIPEGKVGIGSIIPSEKLEVAGNVKAQAYKYTNPKNYYYNVPAPAFTAKFSTDFVIKGSDWAFIFTGDGSGLVAPVQLPHGATITSFTAHYTDNSSTQDIIVRLRQIGGTLATVTSSGTPGTTEGLVTSFFDPVINNLLHPYSIEVMSTPGGWNTGNLQIRYVVIGYTIAEL